MSPSPSRARAAFAIAVAAAIVAVVGYVAITSRSASRPSEPTRLPPNAVTSIPDGPFILFRDSAPGEWFGHLALVHLPVDEAPRRIAPLSCERMHYAAGHGVCMLADQGRLPVRFEAYVFDRAFTRGPAIPLNGPPIRARISPDGRRAALTVFERGHSYADESFSTKTIVVDTATSKVLGDVEDFAVEKDGAPFKSIDFNFWGVTFGKDGDRFYATLKTGGERYLVKGSVDARRAVVVRADVECPSLSPDEAHLVFKKPLASEVGWQLHVLDLASGTERPLNQLRRSVDDQVDWFDDTHVVYHDSAEEGTGIWVLSIDGVTPPELIVRNAYSPAVVRGKPQT
jgi:hypothetical protein